MCIVIVIIVVVAAVVVVAVVVVAGVVVVVAFIVIFSDVVNSTDNGQVIWQWNGKGFNGSNVSTGTYIVRLSTDEGYSTKKISLIK